MSNESHSSIFREFYSEQAFVDRFEKEPERGVDVIIPVMHTNELWHSNLISIYREIPVNRLMLGDGGVVDDSLEIAKKFPRVVIFDHRSFTSLGFSIRKLIESVDTTWFVYLHSDVYLPEGWFDTMEKYQKTYDWYQCRQQLTVQVEYDPYSHDAYISRAYSGSQMGRKDAFKAVLPQIDDDYLYRNEDIIIAHLIEREGLKYGHVDEIFHYHQLMHKVSKWERELKSVDLHTNLSAEEDLRANMTFIKGLIKYSQPNNPVLIDAVKTCGKKMYELNQISSGELRQWTKDTNPVWLKYLPRQHKIINRTIYFLKTIYKKLKKLIIS